MTFSSNHRLPLTWRQSGPIFAPTIRCASLITPMMTMTTPTMMTSCWRWRDAARRWSSHPVPPLFWGVNRMNKWTYWKVTSLHRIRLHDRDKLAEKTITTNKTWRGRKWFCTKKIQDRVHFSSAFPLFCYFFFSPFFIIILFVAAAMRRASTKSLAFCDVTMLWRHHRFYTDRGAFSGLVSSDYILSLLLLFLLFNAKVTSPSYTYNIDQLHGGVVIFSFSYSQGTTETGPVHRAIASASSSLSYSNQNIHKANWNWSC